MNTDTNSRSPFDNALRLGTDRRSDVIENAILDTLAIGETQLYDLPAFASTQVRCIDRNFPSNVGVRGKYSLEPLQ